MLRRLANRIDRRVLRSALYVPAIAAVFVMFRVTEWLLDHYLSAGKSESIVVALAIALGLAVVFQLFHHRVEATVEAWLNRGAHARLHGLEALAEEVPLISDAGVLQQRVIDRIEDVMLTDGAAIYLGTHDAGFELVRSNVDSNPPHVAKDDPAVIHLRLHHRPTAPRSIGSQMPFPMLWPMMVRGTLVGFISVGERRHKESLDAGELKAVATVADAVGVALTMLEPRLSARDARADATATADDGTPSIAVLPLRNLSSEAENEYFADGLSEELLNVLARIPGLRVASRTSAFSFKGQSIDVPTIARKLNVATVLEGSVRTSGKRVRVHAQLIHARSDSPLWSEIYDRELDDIFAVQDDIAKSVVEELRTTLLGEKRTPVDEAQAEADVEAAAIGRSHNAEAYRLYLQGQFLREHLAKERTVSAIACYEKALAIDPDYALAWAGLSRACSDAAGQNWVARSEGYAKAREAADRALLLEPDLPEAHTALGWVLKSSAWDWKGADAAYRRALELAPGSTLSMNGAATLAGNLGRFDEAIAILRRACELDPLNTALRRNLGMYCLAKGALDDADAALNETLLLSPSSGLTYFWLSLVRVEQGRFAEALATIKKEVNEVWQKIGFAVVHHARGETKESDAMLADIVDHYGDEAAYQVAEICAFRGEADKAFEWLDRTYEQHDPGIVYMKMDPLMRGLHADPRWQPFLEKMRLAD